MGAGLKRRGYKNVGVNKEGRSFGDVCESVMGDGG